jgi:hypothetical protein
VTFQTELWACSEGDETRRTRNPTSTRAAMGQVTLVFVAAMPFVAMSESDRGGAVPLTAPGSF